MKRRQHTTKPKRRKASVAARPRRSSVAGLDKRFALLTRERDEALEQQRATAEVLRVISSSPGNLESVFRVVLENAARLCEAYFGVLYGFEDGAFPAIALRGAPPAFAEFQQRGPIHPTPDSGLGRILSTKRPVHITDTMAEQRYLDGEPYAVKAVKLGGSRTVVFVPMLNDDELVGAVAIYRKEVRPFTDKQIDLVQNFAAQAVIAIENARLLSELRESLQQQTATSDVLKIISSSPGELQPVFDTMLGNATQICEANFGFLWLTEGSRFRAVALHGVPPALVGERQREPVIDPGVLSPLGQLTATKKAVHVPNLKTTKGYLQGHPAVVELADVGGARTLLLVPMLKDNELVGAISIYRQEVRPFTDKQIGLVANFAAQAVIAIENTRLLNELRQRTDDLSESLERQTATSEVLKAISRSQGELQPVFQSMLANAVRICEAKFGTLFRYDGEKFHPAALHGAPPTYAEYHRKRGAFVPPPAAPLYDLVQTKDVVRTIDVSSDRKAVEFHHLAGTKSHIAVPMLRDNSLVGAIIIYRQEVQPFTDKQVDLVKNFAAQAVIAIENTRLLSELRQRTGELSEALEQQTATSEVLRIISSSPDDLKPVFETILANASNLCQARYGIVWLCEGDAFRTSAVYGGLPTTFVEQALFRASEDVPAVRAIKTRQPVQMVDLSASQAYRDRNPVVVAGVEVAGIRSLIAVPMLKDNDAVGSVVVYRTEVRPFTDKQIELVQNFAAQAVIAIENTRLLNELRQSLEQQTATADVLKVISRSTFDLQAVLDTLVESAARLCGANRSAIRLVRDGLYHSVADYGFEPGHRERMRHEPLKPGRGSMAGRVVMDNKPVHLLDSQADPDSGLAGRSKLGGVRTMLGVPLTREGVPIGVLLLQRSIVQPFTDKQIELATTFADQAVIAIENVRLFDEIQDKSRQLAEASQHKSQFLANMSHELRTPLNAILGYTELIADGVYGPPSDKMLGVLKRLESNGKHLLGLINDVLDLSKIEAGQLKLDLADYSLETVAQTVHSAVEPLAADKKLRFKTEVAADLPKGHGDERRLTQVLLNLVGNAIKFTDAGDVVITANASNGTFNLSVRDTGPGISVADQAKLFQEFQQADNSITRKKGGTGLGLAISKRIVEMHGGRIWMESVVGQGSTFFVTLPVQAGE